MFFFYSFHLYNIHFLLYNPPIALKPKMKSHYRGHKMAVWLNLIPQLHRPGDTEVSMRHHHFRERDPHFYAGKYSSVVTRIYNLILW